MKSLYLRIYLTLVLVLALFALASGWLLQRQLEAQRVRADASVRERMAGWGELLQRSLPEAQASPAEQTAALLDWSLRLRIPMALDDPAGRRIAESESYFRRDRLLAREGRVPADLRWQPIRFEDGRTLWVPRATGRAGGRIAGLAPGGGGGAAAGRGADSAMQRWFGLGLLPDGRGVLVLLVVLFVAVAAAAWPVVRGLTRRLEALKAGVDAFGAGALTQRVPEEGRDEVAALASSFNRAAGRIEALVRSHQSLLANASHELRSPLARLKMAVSMLDDSNGLGADDQAAAPAADREHAAASRSPDPDAKLRASLRKEIHTNISELDALVEEVLLASRLDAAAVEGSPAAAQRVDLLVLAAEEASALGVQLDVEVQVQNNSLIVAGDERLLRRAVRNLLENAKRYGGQDVELRLSQRAGQAELQVCDRGPGVPEAYRERIFEAFFRLPGHAEREGGVGLGLALVRQIAQRHAGQVRCVPRNGGGSCFVLVLPLSGVAPGVVPGSAAGFAPPAASAPPGPPATPSI